MFTIKFGLKASCYFGGGDGLYFDFTVFLFRSFFCCCLKVKKRFNFNVLKLCDWGGGGEEEEEERGTFSCLFFKIF